MSVQVQTFNPEEPFHNMNRLNGLHIPLGKGFYVSIQWNAGNYGSNYSLMGLTDKQPLSASQVELAFIKQNEGVIEIPAWNDCVKGYLSVEQVWQEIDAFRRANELL